jgi:hypothetical protein
LLCGVAFRRPTVCAWFLWELKSSGDSIAAKRISGRMTAVLNSILAKAGALFQRAQRGDAIVIGGAVLLGAAIVGLYGVSRDAYCTRHLKEEQKAFLKPTEVSVRGTKVAIQPVTQQTLKPAALSMAAAYSCDPLVTACEQEVSMLAMARCRAY